MSERRQAENLSGCRAEARSLPAAAKRVLVDHVRAPVAVTVGHDDVTRASLLRRSLISKRTRWAKTTQLTERGRATVAFVLADIAEKLIAAQFLQPWDPPSSTARILPSLASPPLNEFLILAGDDALPEQGATDEHSADTSLRL